jgi:hypothetical protein
LIVALSCLENLIFGAFRSVIGLIVGLYETVMKNYQISEKLFVVLKTLRDIIKIIIFDSKSFQFQHGE